ncbi:MAG: hypothetical protein HY077_12715 [Elusimicrobia bacterium]|nr:hypothetical protein [Elusimicrobiota bacterium]
MKTIVLAVLAFLSAAPLRAEQPVYRGLVKEAGADSLIPAPAAAPRLILACNGCTMDSGVYKRVLYYRCTNGSTYITDDGAQDAARWAREGRLDVDAFLKSFYRTCDFSEAAAIGKGSASGALSASVYNRVLYYRCTNGSTCVTHSGAQDVAKWSNEGSIDVEAFMNSFYRTCDYSDAVEVGKGSSAGVLSASVYNRVLYYRCSNGSTYVTHKGAADVARRASADTINVGTFMDVFYRTCEFDSAVKVACR